MAALLTSAALLALAVGCGVVAFGVRRGSLALPWFDSRLGSFRLVGYSTWNAQCPPFTGCGPTRQEAYVIWLINGAGASQIVQLPISHE